MRKNLLWRPKHRDPLHPLQQGSHPCSFWNRRSSHFLPIEKHLPETLFLIPAANAFNQKMWTLLYLYSFQCSQFRPLHYLHLEPDQPVVLTPLLYVQAFSSISSCQLCLGPTTVFWPLCCFHNHTACSWNFHLTKRERKAEGNGPDF